MVADEMCLSRSQRVALGCACEEGCLRVGRGRERFKYGLFAFAIELDVVRGFSFVMIGYPPLYYSVCAECRLL